MTISKKNNGKSATKISANNPEVFCAFIKKVRKYSHNNNGYPENKFIFMHFISNNIESIDDIQYVLLMSFGSQWNVLLHFSRHQQWCQHIHAQGRP